MLFSDIFIVLRLRDPQPSNVKPQQKSRFTVTYSTEHKFPEECWEKCIPLGGIPNDTSARDFKSRKEVARRNSQKTSRPTRLSELFPKVRKEDAGDIFTAPRPEVPKL